MAVSVMALDQLASERIAAAGGKGGTLARLRQAGYRVPDGCIVFPEAFAGEELLPEAWRVVQATLARMRGGDPDAAFAVRSSALDGPWGASEDSGWASFAGQFESVLGPRSDAEVRTAILRVRRSRHSGRVQAYGRARGLEPSALGDGPEMAVIVQRLVRAELAGVLFTADPVTGRRSQMAGNYVHGLGDRLVSGEAEPQEFRISRIKKGYEGPAELERYARRLLRLGTRLEQDLGSPQDIEWAVGREGRRGWARGRVYVLQSRPITTLTGFNPIRGEFNDSLTGDYAWSCVNIGEALGTVMTPFTWSAVRTCYAELDVVPGYNAAGNIGGRAYQNVTVMTAALRALGRNVEQLGAEVGGVREEYLERLDEYLTPLPGVSLLSTFPRALRMLRKQRAGLKGLPAFLAENPGWCQTMRLRLEAGRSREELVRDLDEVMDRTLQTFWRTVATVWLYGERTGKLRRELREQAGAEDADALLSNVSGHEELLASLGPVVGLAQVARGDMSRETYLEKWGHRGPLETEASVPRPAEDPGWLDRQLAAYAAAPVDVEGLMAERRATFEAAWQRYATCFPRKAGRMRRRLEQAAEAARLREAVRSEFTRLVWVARAWALCTGSVTGIEDGVFYLTVEELLDLLAGDEGAVCTIPARRATYERYKALPPFPMMIRGRFDPFAWAADPNQRSDVYDALGALPQVTVKDRSDAVVAGMPGSAGRVEGVVRRLDSSEQGAALQPGEILVTSQTNIGWTLFFPRAAAIVTDIGAPLSHAAIVARELGIPAVVNCGDATARLHTGDVVQVDGTAGTVTILHCS